MAPRKSSQRRSVSAAGKATAGISTVDIVGTYAYKFSGYVMLQLRPWWLTGLGKFTIEAPNAVGTAKVTGEHRSSVMVLRGQGAVLTLAIWRLTGTIFVQDDGTGAASLLLTRAVIDPKREVRRLQAEFNVLVPGNDRLWMISAGAHSLVGNKIKPAQESVQIEARRVPY